MCITIEERRRRIATVPQEIELFPGSVLDNILSFSQYDIVDKIDPEDIKFLENPAFTLFYQRLPQGLHTQVGQGGANLSGGQKQWIGIMRALIRKPELLLLDEATSAMDATSEQQFISLLKKLKTSAGILFVSHRLHVLPKLCDRIYVMEDNYRIYEGRHDDLIHSDSLYGKFWSEINNIPLSI